MKKLFIALLLVLMFAVPTAADNPINVFVNEKPVCTGILIDDRTYVPVRFVSEAMKAEVNYDQWGVHVNTNVLHRPIIEGDAGFVSMINQALDLLEQKDFPHYAMICQGTYLINRETKEMDIAEEFFAFSSLGCYTTITNRIIDKPERYNPKYLAGVLVHEGCHNIARLYDKDFYNDDAKELETIAYINQLGALTLVGAPSSATDETAKLAKSIIE